MDLDLKSSVQVMDNMITDIGRFPPVLRRVLVKRASSIGPLVLDGVNVSGFLDSGVFILSVRSILLVYRRQ